MVGEEMDKKYGRRSGLHGMSARRKPKNDIFDMKARGLLAQVHKGTIAPRFDAITVSGMAPHNGPLLGFMLSQYWIKKGLKLFGELVMRPCVSRCNSCMIAM